MLQKIRWLVSADEGVSWEFLEEKESTLCLIFVILCKIALFCVYSQKLDDDNKVQRNMKRSGNMKSQS